MTDTYQGQTENTPEPTVFDRLQALEENQANIYNRLSEIDARLDRIESAIGLPIGHLPRPGIEGGLRATR